MKEDEARDMHSLAVGSEHKDHGTINSFCDGALPCHAAQPAAANPRPLTADEREVMQQAIADSAELVHGGRLQPAAASTPGPAILPVAFALRWPGDPRLNLSTVFDTEEEAKEYTSRCEGPISVVPLYEASRPAAASTPAPTAQEAETRFLNLVLDIRRVIGWEKPINDFDVVRELEEYIEDSLLPRAFGVVKSSQPAAASTPSKKEPK